MTILLWLLTIAWQQQQRQQPEAALKPAIEAHQKGDLDAAVRLYRDYLKTHSSSFEVHSNLGAILARQGLYGEAIAEYNAALRLAPNNPSISLNLAIAYYKSGDIGLAAEELKALHNKAPDVQRVTLLLADCRLRLGENQKVIDLLNPYDKDDKTDPAVVYMLGTALIREKQMVRGQLMLDRILKNGDSSEARLLLGTAKLSVADFAGALQELGKAVELNPKLTTANGLYGQALMATGDTAAATKSFRSELALDPTDFDSNLNLASILRQDQDNDGARKLLDMALRVRPGDLRVRYQLASILLAENKTAEARASLEGIVKEAPKFTEAHVSLATVYYRLKLRPEGDRERAIVLKLNEESQAQQPKGDPLSADKKP